MTNVVNPNVRIAPQPTSMQPLPMQQLNTAQDEAVQQAAAQQAQSTREAAEQLAVQQAQSTREAAQHLADQQAYSTGQGARTQYGQDGNQQAGQAQPSNTNLPTSIAPYRNLLESYSLGGNYMTQAMGSPKANSQQSGGSSPTSTPSNAVAQSLSSILNLGSNQGSMSTHSQYESPSILSQAATATVSLGSSAWTVSYQSGTTAASSQSSLSMSSSQQSRTTASSSSTTTSASAVPLWGACHIPDEGVYGPMSCQSGSCICKDDSLYPSRTLS